MSQEMKPFLLNTRRKTAYVGRVSFEPGKKSTPLPIPKVGYLIRFWLVFRGSVALNSTATLNEKGIYAMFERILYKINVQNAELVDLTGFDAYLLSNTIERSAAPDKVLNAADTTYYHVPRTDAEQNADSSVRFVLPVLVSAGTGFDAEACLVPLQSQGLNSTLEFRFAAQTEIYNNLTDAGLSGEVEVYYEYFEMPDPKTVKLPEFNVIRRISEQQTITAAGEQLYQVPAMGHLLQMFHYAQLDNKLSNAIEEIYIKVNKTERLTTEAFEINRFGSRMRLGNDLPKGVVMHDFWHSWGLVSQGSLREAIDTTAIAELESCVKIPTAVTMGAPGTNQLFTVRTILQTVSYAAKG